MSKKTEVIAIIPARSGSKGVHEKNIRELNGKPLLAYSIEAALSAPNIQRVIVSTDSPVIGEIAKDYGAEVPFLRPAEIAGDTAMVMDAIEFTCFGLGLGKNPGKCVAALYPSHPFRSGKMVTELVDKLIEGFSPVQTVREIPLEPDHFFSMNEGGLERFRFGDSGPQAATVFFQACGTFDGHARAGGGRPYYHVMKNEIEWIDIDYEEDFLLAEEVVRKGLYDFGGGA